MSLLSLTDVTAGYGPSEVLHGITLDVDPGEVVVMLGANGAGKTTTMQAIAGLLTWRGSIELDGRPLPQRPEQVVRSGVSLVPQGRGTLGALTVLENLRVGAAVRTDTGGIGDDIDRWCEVFPVLGRRSRQLAGTLSGGEQQMLAVARALMSRPRLLLCDEPSLGLAPIVVQELFATLAHINETDGTAMLIVEQNAELAMDLASTVYLLDVGTIAASGTPADFRADDAVRTAYLGY
ncbi:amino acid/amide ABC transporter ATP-binding protein 2 (HAAT family) [Humibacillus xanthopallidus]|uniref:Amino acid/amide ABC transporter ATP-binding protein 2 (HAAT family) n=1 Tax=Humibacillus xanthopallidus TaxID=412689 RepID=A0A543PRY7_9MICO|nr:ABC transporter ATP-binding protein [Humibacillus xanthopallidus]TQN46815.1 amino acid/amide ABC transporter ATP-binding protein 2 (HAAT family) [Humibacillus xanthopallidus]